MTTSPLASPRPGGRTHALRAVWALVVLSALVLSSGLASCGSTDGASSYGGSQNHLHDLLALHGAPHTLLLATHIGVYRTADAGQTWQEVAAGAGQAMDGLMVFRLAQSPVAPQRAYVLAIVRTSGKQKTPPGLYTSADFGRTWHLAAPLTAFPSPSVYTIGTGAATPGQVFAIVSALGAQGLYESLDAGSHWQALPTLPTSAPSGIAGDPADPGRLLLWSAADGLFLSTDDGQQWAPASGVQHGIYAVTWAGKTVYAAGDAGLYRSDDAGDHFSLVNAQVTFDAVAACAAQPRRAYALTGTAVYKTQDGGATWSVTAPTTDHPGDLTVDPTDPNVVFAGLSFPLGVDRTTDGGAHWRAVLP